VVNAFSWHATLSLTGLRAMYRMHVNRESEGVRENSVVHAYADSKE
jgi:hypothetical protein